MALDLSIPCKDRPIRLAFGLVQERHCPAHVPIGDMHRSLRDQSMALAD